jgi:hypothetical protein
MSRISRARAAQRAIAPATAQPANGSITKGLRMAEHLRSAIALPGFGRFFQYYMPQLTF